MAAIDEGSESMRAGVAAGPQMPFAFDRAIDRLGWAGSGRGLSAPASPGDRRSELPTVTLTVPSPEGSGPAGRLKEIGFGIGFRLCLALLPSGRPAIDFTALSPKGRHRYVGDRGRPDRFGFPKRLTGHGWKVARIPDGSKG